MVWRSEPADFSAAARQFEVMAKAARDRGWHDGCGEWRAASQVPGGKVGGLPQAPARGCEIVAWPPTGQVGRIVCNSGYEGVAARGFDASTRCRTRQCSEK